MWLAFLAQSAFAGFQIGAIAGAGLPTDSPTTSEAPGLEGGLYAGWRASAGPVHLQPELVGRLNTGGPGGGVLVGGSVSFGELVHIGPYAHAGVGVVGYPEPNFDAGALAEVRPPLVPVAVGLRIGWERMSAAHYKCGDCLQPADNWLMIAATIGLAL